MNGRQPSGPRPQITYLGYATVLIDLDGTRIVTDPVLRSWVAR
jgi:L-ascorbate metabolism protein UlaG (beta-lactamase superfamily)